jgi:hypothetical protein
MFLSVLDMLSLDFHLLLMHVCPVLIPGLFICSSASNNTTIVRVQSHANAGIIEEHLIDLFKGTSRCFDAKLNGLMVNIYQNTTQTVFVRGKTYKVDEWNKGEAYYSPNPEVVSADRFETKGCYHYDDTIDASQQSSCLSI